MRHQKICFMLEIVLMGWLVATAHAYEPGYIEVPPGYQLQKVMATAIGLPYQTALLPDGSLVLTDPNNHRIVRIQDNVVSTLISGSEIKTSFVATSPDGKIIYGTMDNRVMALDIQTGLSSIVGYAPSGDWINALATDPMGNVYVTTGKLNVLQIEPTGIVTVVATNLPFDHGNAIIHDVDVASDGTVYVAGSKRVVAIDQTGRTRIIADGLNNEPVWVEVAPDNTVYINECTYGLQRYNPSNNTLTQIQHNDLHPFGDILAPTVDELIFYEIQRLLVKFNFVTHELLPLFSIVGNSFAFAVNGSNTAFIGTPNHPPFLDSYIVSLQADGTRKDLMDLTYPNIISVDVDSYDRLCLATSQGFYRLELNGKISDITPIFPAGSDYARVSKLAVSPYNDWYVISTTWKKVQVYKFSTSGSVNFLPIVFEPSVI